MSPEPDRDALAGVRARVETAYATADRLFHEAEQAARAAAGDVPPSGWAPPARDAGAPDLTALLALVEGLRHALPPELAHRLASAVRELLMALRALLDWWIERLDRSAEPAPEVRDIPIR